MKTEDQGYCGTEVQGKFSKIRFFLKQKTREEIKIVGTGWLFLILQSWGASKGVRCMKSEDQGYCGPGVQGNFSKI